MPTLIELWQCIWCFNRFDSEEKCKNHEKVCGYNPHAEHKIYMHIGPLPVKWDSSS